MTQRARRSTRAQLDRAEGQQRMVLDGLLRLDGETVAERIARCQSMRTSRRGRPRTWPWRCRSPGCWACRRTRVTAEWHTLLAEVPVPSVALTAILLPLHRSGESLRCSVSVLRRTLRDLRDHAASHDRRWRRVAVAGLAGSEQAWVLCWHQGISREEIERVFRRRWPGAHAKTAEEVYNEAADSDLLRDDAVALALHRRGIEPLRIRIGPMQGAVTGRYVDARRPMRPEPLPILFA